MRYSDYLNQVNVRHRTVNYNLLTSKNKSKDKGSLAPPKIELSAKQAFDLLAPYCSSRIMEQVKAVVPLAAYLMIFQILVLLRLGLHSHRVLQPHLVLVAKHTCRN